MNNLIIMVTFHIKKGLREDYIRAIQETGVPALIRKENGCLRYEYYLPVDAPDDVLLVEEWADPECQKKHLEQPHLAATRALKPVYVESQEKISCIRN